MSTPDEFQDVYVDGYDEDATYFVTIIDATSELVAVNPAMPTDLPPGQIALEFDGSPMGMIWNPQTRTMEPQPVMPPPGIPSNEEQMQEFIEQRFAGLRLMDLVDVDIDDDNLEDGYTLTWSAADRTWRAGPTV